jgi:N-glycosylase/DNA lyase
METKEARNELIKLSGVGPKVADCILLFSGTKFDVFPTDVWIKRIMEVLYFKREATFKEINQFSKDHFGSLSGYAQQYLFFFARETRIS